MAVSMGLRVYFQFYNSMQCIELILESVLEEQQYDEYSTLISANGNSLLDGFLESYDCL